MTVLIGRRRIGKTTLLTKSAEGGDRPLLYLYVSKDNERVLTGKFQDAAEQSLGMQIFGRMETFAQYLDNLEEDYSYIHRKQPMFSKPNGRNSRWQLDDCFLRFWFRFIMRNQALVEMERNDLLLEIVEKGYEQYTGHVLEQYFRQKWMEEERITSVGNYWDRKGLNEIDMIALNDIDKTATVAEIKRQRKKFCPTELAEKTSTLNKELAGYSVAQIGLSMEDM